MGTWAAPQTEEQARAIEIMMCNPIPADVHTGAIWNYIGDDAFWDHVIAVREFEPHTDIRPLIASKLGSWMAELPHRDSWKNPWDPVAVEICRKIARLYDDWDEDRRLKSFQNKYILKVTVEGIEEERQGG